MKKLYRIRIDSFDSKIEWYEGPFVEGDAQAQFDGCVREMQREGGPFLIFPTFIIKKSCISAIELIPYEDKE